MKRRINNACEQQTRIYFIRSGLANALASFIESMRTNERRLCMLYKLVFIYGVRKEQRPLFNKYRKKI